MMQMKQKCKMQITTCRKSDSASPVDVAVRIRFKVHAANLWGSMRAHPALFALLFIALWSSCSPTGIYCRKCGAKLADTAQLTDKGPYQSIDRIQHHGHQLYKVDHGDNDVEMVFGKRVSKT